MIFLLINFHSIKFIKIIFLFKFIFDSKYSIQLITYNNIGLEFPHFCVSLLIDPVFSSWDRIGSDLKLDLRSSLWFYQFSFLFLRFAFSTKTKENFLDLILDQNRSDLMTRIQDLLEEKHKNEETPNLYYYSEDMRRRISTCILLKGNIIYYLILLFISILISFLMLMNHFPSKN